MPTTRDLASVGDRLDRLRHGAGAADLHDALDAATVGAGQYLGRPFGGLNVVDHRIRPELPEPLGLLVGRGRRDHACTYCLRELEREQRHASGPLGQDGVAWCQPGERRPRRHGRARERRGLLKG